tara:strand:+ start:212 stop:772 length:561 start_codon:yes stop_codon:yes gene_type:complete
MVYIYKIYCKDKDIKDCYIGSTTRIKRRIAAHKHSCNKENSKAYNNYKYTFIRENGGFENWNFDIICKCPKQDRYIMERWYIENTAYTNLNKYIPNRSRKERNETNKKNKEKIQEYYKEYIKKNKNKYKNYDKNYQELNKDTIKDRKNKKYECECGGKYTNANKNQHLKTIKHKTFISSKEVVVKT